MRFAVALLAAATAACSSGGKTGPTAPPNGSDTGSGSDMGSGSGSAVAAQPAEVAVTDAASAAANAGKAAAVTGKAGNAKLGAVVMMSDRVPVYCRPLESWPSEVSGKQITAHGKLEQSDEFAAEGGGAGTSGAVWVLRDCTYDPP
jgi:hypothetical protein